eukprot:5427861-Prymnesium_polylepis.1
MKCEDRRAGRHRSPHIGLTSCLGGARVFVRVGAFRLFRRKARPLRGIRRATHGDSCTPPAPPTLTPIGRVSARTDFSGDGWWP